MKPNVLLIQCDDLGPDDLGMEGPYTPYLLKLKEEAFSAADFSVQPVCSPSRAELLTGRHPLRGGVSHVHGGKDFLHLDETTLAERFREGGYATGMWGKWHLGHSEGYFPWQRGFDEAYMADLYKHRQTRGRLTRGQLNGVEVSSDQWADEYIVDMAANFIHRKRRQSWFAYLPTLTPHTPHDAPEHWVQFHLNRGCPPGLAVNRAMISFLDEQIGRLMKGLEKTGQAENTVVVFLSDHGPAIAANELDDADRTLRNRSGRRGWKGDLYENGLQSPLFIRWPESVPPQVCRDPIQLVDLSATLLDLCGISGGGLEGQSFASTLLRGESFKTGDMFTYAHRGWLTSGPPYSMTGIPGEYAPGRPGPFMEQCLAIRRGMHKVILNPEFSSRGEVVLYDLEADPTEQVNLAGDMPQLRDELLIRLEAWWEEVLREPHAFHPPVLRVKAGLNMFAANLPCRVSGGARNGVNGVTGWETPDASLSYQLNVCRAGRARLRLRHAAPKPERGECERAEWRFSLSNGHEGVVGNAFCPEFDLTEGEVILTLRPERISTQTRLKMLEVELL